MQHRVELVGRASEPRHHLGRGEGQHPLHLGVVMGGDGGVERPVGVVHVLHERAGLLLDLVDGGGGLGALLETQRSPQSRHGLLLAAEHLRGAQDREHQVDPRRAGRRRAEHVEAVADLGVLDLAEPAVHVQDEVVERLVVGLLLQPQISVHLGGMHELPDLAADRRQLGRVHRGDVGVLVEQLFEARDVAVRLRTRHRGDQVVDDRRVRAPLGLRALTRVVDEERVDQRQVGDRGVRRTGRRERGVLARQPFHRAVLAEVDDGMRAEAAPLDGAAEPAVGSQIVVRRGEVGVVIDGDRVLPEAARRLDQQHHVAGGDGGQHDLVGVVDEELPGRLAPRRRDLVAQVARKVGGPVVVVGLGDAHVGVGELGTGQPLLVLAAGRDQRMDQRVAGLGVPAQVGVAVHVGVAGQVGVHGQVGGQIETRNRTDGPDVVAGVPHPAQQSHGRHRGVEADRVADPRVLGGVGRQHQRDLALGRRDPAEPRMVDRDAGHPGTPLGVSDVVGQPVGV